MSRIGYDSGKSPNNNVISFLAQHMETHPDSDAIVWATNQRDWVGQGASTSTPLTHSSATFRMLWESVDRVAAGFKAMGIRKGDRVIIFLPMGFPMYSAMFAVQKLGAIAVFLDSWARRNHLGASAACAEPVAMISFKQAFDLVKDVPEFAAVKLRVIAGPGHDDPGTSYSGRLEVMMVTPGTVAIEPVESETSALVTFTTGSSGTPKGANRTHRFLAAQHEALDRVIPYTASDRDLPAFPIFCLNNIAAGVTTIMPGLNLAEPGEHDAALLVAQLVHQKITCTTLSPAMLRGVSAYCTQHKITLAGIRRGVTGGAPISRDDVRAFKAIAPNCRLWILYGSTEVEPMAHIPCDEMLGQEPPSDPEIVEDGVNVGMMDEHLKYKFIKIIDGAVDLARTPWKSIEQTHGEIGELIVSGDHVCRDYYNNEEAFRRAKIRDTDGNVWHRTGDLARMDDRKQIWLVGRVHNAITRSAKYYFPVRAEVILNRQFFVRQGAYLGMPSPTLGERCVVAVELEPGKLARDDARREIERLFKKNELPVDELVFVDHIPMDPRHHSKVEYGDLKVMIEAAAK